MNQKKKNPLKVILIVLYLIYMLLPIISTYLFSIAVRWDRTILPEGYTLDAYRSAIHLSYFTSSLKNSLILSILSCLVSFILIVPTVYWAHNYVPKIKPVMDLLMILPFTIPTVVLALSYVRVYNKPPFSRSPALLIMATVIFTLPYMYRSVSNSVEAIDIKTLTESAQSLGANVWQTLTMVIIPNIFPGILSGMLLVFATVFADFTLAKLITGAKFKTFPMLLVEQTQVDGSVSAALSVISFSIAWIISMILLWVSSKTNYTTKKAAGRKI